MTDKTQNIIAYAVVALTLVGVTFVILRSRRKSKGILVEGEYSVPENTPNRVDALHSFESRRSDGFGGKMSTKIKEAMSKLYQKGINPDVSDVKNIDTLEPIAKLINDWCIDLETGVLDSARFQAMLHAYSHVRPLNAQERDMINPMLRAAALRFWISRLWDFHLPREASMLQPHDPMHFERILTQRLHHPVTL
jgi:hypothetical protein